MVCPRFFHGFSSRFSHIFPWNLSDSRSIKKRAGTASSWPWSARPDGGRSVAPCLDLAQPQWRPGRPVVAMVAAVTPGRVDDELGDIPSGYD